MERTEDSPQPTVHMRVDNVEIRNEVERTQSRIPEAQGESFADHAPEPLIKDEVLDPPPRPLRDNQDVEVEVSNHLFEHEVQWNLVKPQIVGSKMTNRSLDSQISRGP